MNTAAECRRSVVVNLPDGLHLRPASLVAQVSAQFACEVRLVKDAQAVNAKSVLDVMTLGAEQGTELTLEARGQDACLAVERIAALFTTDFATPNPSADPQSDGAPKCGAPKCGGRTGGVSESGTSENGGPSNGSPSSTAPANGPRSAAESLPPRQPGGDRH